MEVAGLEVVGMEVAGLEVVGMEVVGMQVAGMEVAGMEVVGSRCRGSRHRGRESQGRSVGQFVIKKDDLCLVCFKPMAPLYYWDTACLVKLWCLEEKTRLIKTIFYFKRHKCRRSTKSLQKLFKGCKAAKSFERSFWDLAYF